MNYKARNSIIAEMGYADYAAYLASPLWKGIRARVYAAKGRNCVHCKSCKAQAVHHADYDKPTMLGDVIDSLMPVCDDCHEALHRSKKRRVNSPLKPSAPRTPKKLSAKKRRKMRNAEWARQEKRRCSCGNLALPGQLMCRQCPGKQKNSCYGKPAKSSWTTGGDPTRFVSPHLLASTSQAPATEDVAEATPKKPRKPRNRNKVTVCGVEIKWCLSCGDSRSSSTRGGLCRTCRDSGAKEPTGSLLVASAMQTCPPRQCAKLLAAVSKAEGSRI